MLVIYCLEAQTSPSRFFDLLVLAIICSDYRFFIVFFRYKISRAYNNFQENHGFYCLSIFLEFKKAEEGNKITHLSENYCLRSTRLLY